MQQLPAVEEFPDVQYIIQYPQPIPVTFHPFQQLFTNDILNIATFYKFVKILVHFHVIQELILIIYIKLDGDNGDNDDNGDNGKISGNVINKLITEITA